MSNVWTPELASGWLPPEKISVSEWAGRHRVIVSDDAAEPGAWHNDRTPYLVGVMDALGDDEHEEVVFVAGARVGKTETARNALGYWVDQDPGPILWVYPTEDSAKEQVRNEIIPLFSQVPRLSRHLTGNKRDLTFGEMRFRTCALYTGWAGSAQSLASRTIRRVVFDEIDKFPSFAGRDADPVSLGRRRVLTYGSRAKVGYFSTPTTTEGPIWALWQRCTDKRKYHVPCIHCGFMHELVWENVRWAGFGSADTPDLRLMQADEIEDSREAWFECPVCSGKLNESARISAVRQGEWVSEGFPLGEHPVSRRVGFHISALYSSLGVTLPRLVGEYLRAQDDFGALMEFVTQVLGLPFDGIRETGGTDVVSRIYERDKFNMPGVCPPWAQVVTIGADTQKDHYVWVARCWGADGHSRLLDFGKASDSDSLVGLLERPFPVANSNRTLKAPLILVDAGGAVQMTDDWTTTDEVYMLSVRDRRIIPAMGRDRVEPPYLKLKVGHNFGKAFKGNVLYHQPDFFKDVLADWMNRSEEFWELCAAVTPEYIQHFANSCKVEMKDGTLRWGRRFDKADIDFHDAETLALIAFRLLELGTLATREAPPKPTRPERVWVDASGWWGGWRK